MKSFLFIVFLWTLAISQMVNSAPVAVEESKDLVAAGSELTKSIVFKGSFCREDGSEKVLFERSLVTISLYSNSQLICNQNYLDHQIEVFEAREQYEYQIWMGLSSTEVTLAESSFTK